MESAAHKTWRDTHRDQVQAARKKYRETHPGYREAEWRRNLMRHYGMTPDTFDALLEVQGGKCAICGCSEEANGQRFAVDHSHSTGAIRGLLCVKCNAGLGNFCDCTGRLEFAIEYLVKHR